MATMCLYVKDAEGSVHFVEANLEGTVEDVCVQAARAMGVEVHLLRLRLGEEILVPEDLICDTSIGSEDTLFAETLTPFRFAACGAAGDILAGGMQFKLARALPDYAVARMSPPIQVGETATWAVLVKGSPRVDFGVTCREGIRLDDHCRDNTNHIWHITGVSRTASATHLCVYNDEAAGTVPYELEKGVVVQMTLSHQGGTGVLSCEFQDAVTRAPIACFPQPITGISSTAWPVWSLDDPSVAEIVMPSLREEA